jgi:dTMP kinase
VIERGRIIILEGAYSSGKTTQARMLHEAMCMRKVGADMSLSPVLVREPGGTGLGERVRSLLLEDGVSRCSKSDLMLFCAARAQLLEDAVRPAIESGRDVVMDRCWLSSVVYQGVLGGCGQTQAMQTCRLAGASGDLIGDLLIYLAVGSDDQYLRTAARTDGHRFHRYEPGAVIRAYESALASIAHLAPEYVTGGLALRRVNAVGTIGEVHQLVLAVYDEWRRTV